MSALLRRFDFSGGRAAARASGFAVFFDSSGGSRIDSDPIERGQAPMGLLNEKVGFGAGELIRQSEAVCCRLPDDVALKGRTSIAQAIGL